MNSTGYKYLCIYVCVSNNNIIINKKETLNLERRSWEEWKGAKEREEMI